MSYVRKLLSTTRARASTKTRDTRVKSPKQGNAKSGDTCFFCLALSAAAIVFHLSREIYALPDAPDLLPYCLPGREAVHYPGQRGVCVIQTRLKVCGTFLYAALASMQHFFQLLRL